jgi:DNA (cytosine-5)-methyltransferase 1
MRKSKKEIRVFEAFAGYGGAHFALKKADKIKFKVSGFSEINEQAIKIYQTNFPGIKNYGDIKRIVPKKLPKFDLFTGGFPCQPFSSAGRGLGEVDTRGTLFHDILRICAVRKPKFILLENVKGFLFQKHEKTRLTIRYRLKSLGYHVYPDLLLNTKDFGIPQNRERVWIMAVRKKCLKKESINILPKKEAICLPLKEFLDPIVPEKYYLTQKQIEHLEWKHKLRCVTPEPLCLDIYNKKIRYDKVSITITEPHHNSLRIVEPMVDGRKIVRKITPDEAFGLMGFSRRQIKNAGLADTHLHRLAANGWDINIASIILKKLISANSSKVVKRKKTQSAPRG